MSSPSKSRRSQGRILRLHFACSAPVPPGTSLRVSSSVSPPPQNDVPDDGNLPPGMGDDASVASGGGDDVGGGGLGTDWGYGGSTGGMTRGVGGPSDDPATAHARLLQNTVEMYTDPDSYPVWRTRKPVVVVDDGGGGNKSDKILSAKGLEAAADEGDEGGPLPHRYRYVAVTPGATIDWSLSSRKELTGGDHDDRSRGSASTGRGNLTVATTPPGSYDELDKAAEEQPPAPDHRASTPSVEEAEGLALEDAAERDHGEEDEEDEFPPVLYENPHTPRESGGAEGAADGGDDDAKKSHHHRDPSVFDAQGNPVSLLGTSDSTPSLTDLGVSAASSFASMTISGSPYKKSPVMTWEGVSSLPYRTRGIEGSDREATDVKIVDSWNDGNDPAFKACWELRKKDLENKNEGLKGATVAGEDDAHPPICDDDPMDADAEGEGQRHDSIYIVCYHLPVILSRDPSTNQWNACWSESLIAKSDLHGVSSTRRTTWVGTVSNIPSALLRSPTEREAIRRVLGAMDCIPVFFADDEASENLVDLMYLGFCKQVLWPSFHNVDLLDLATNGWGQRQRDTARGDPVAACALAAAEAKERRGAAASAEGEGEMKSDWDQRRLDSWWNAYVRVNQKFADVVSGLVEGGDVVWVHDYHLALMPRMLREARGEANVATAHHHPQQLQQSKSMVKPVRMIFFIHVPFPTSQVFRELEHGEALLGGMLHADVVGFHAFDHARHFLNAAKRILGLAYESLAGGLIGLRHRGTRVVVTVSNVSVEADIISALMEFPSVREESAALTKKHGGRMIVSGIAVAQRLSGVSYKLLAFERLLADYPVWQSRVVLLQRCLIPGARRVDEADTLREVRSLVQRIRSRFGGEVIDYEEQVGSVLPIDQRLAIWTASRVMMHAPIREGLNLCPLEYVFARREPADPGVVIASEFSAVSSVLNGALRVNPYDVQMCVATIDAALSMSREERDLRRGRDIDFVSRCPSGLWTRNVLRDLNDATLEEGDGRLRAVGDGPPDPSSASEPSLAALDVPALGRAYERTGNRVLVIDFNGTLVVKEPAGKYLKREILGTSGFKPSHVTILALRRLCADPKNTVYVVSGDSQQNLDAAVGNVPGLGLAASNGTCFADPGGQGTSGRAWQYLDFGVDWNAVKKVAMPIISKFTARTNGSFVKLSHSSIGWSYYSCDPEWGSLQASHLVSELGDALRSFDVRFVALKGIVEVVPRKGHKGHIVKKILEDARSRGGEVDFVLCMGDDVSDEKMFTSVVNFSAGSVGQDSYAFNVAVGKKPTNASFYVDDASDVSDVLVALSGDRRLLDGQASSDGSAASEDFFA